MSSSSPSSATTGQIPALATSDIAHAISLIQAAYAPPAASDFPALQSLQSALLAMQRTPAAWGLIVPLLTHEDTNVQFFGAHTAHAKISREGDGGAARGGTGCVAGRACGGGGGEEETCGEAEVVWGVGGAGVGACAGSGWWSEWAWGKRTERVGGHGGTAGGGGVRGGHAHEFWRARRRM
ncbi:hypothetical protein B0H13DRAFT_2455972 [Mycena leptocephala]|nr:hypothetical protein B0H13DRAFT_2455972 [Mycena leptocephala]